jgi:hypothetical protein
MTEVRAGLSRPPAAQYRDSSAPQFLPARRGGEQALQLLLPLPEGFCRGHRRPFGGGTVRLLLPACLLGAGDRGRWLEGQRGHARLLVEKAQLRAEGGLADTAGGLLEFLSWPVLIPGVLGPHELFHIFILLGAALHWRFTSLIACGTVPPRRGAAVAPP